MARLGRIIPLAWALYFVFLFLPSARGVDVSRAGFETVAIEIGAAFDAHGGEQRGLLGAVGLSHVIMIVSPLILFTSRRSIQVSCVVLLSTATILQFYMVWWLRRFEMLEVGSYLSALAFAILTVGFYLRLRAARQGLGQVAGHAVQQPHPGDGKMTFSPPFDDPGMEKQRAMDIRIVYCET